MHELGIAQEVLRIVETNAAEHGEGRVTLLRLSVGEMSGVEPEALRFALEVCARDTRAAGMRVEIKTVPTIAQCRDCRAEWDFQAGRIECPTCGKTHIALQGGEDLRVDSFEME